MASTTPERFLLLAGTIATASGPFHVKRGDLIPLDILPEERKRLEELNAIGVPKDDPAINAPLAAIDIFTTQPHYFDHVVSVAGALRLPVQIPKGLAPRCGGPLLAPFAADRPIRTQSVALVMGPGDIRTAVRHGWEHIAYLCHGVGQDYNNLLAAAAPGENIPWERVGLVLLPSEYAAARFAELCPAAEKVVVGQPKLDFLARLESRDERCAALSFRWNHQRCPEARGAIDHYRNGLAEVAAYCAAHDVKLIGHGHPRIFTELASSYMAAGIEPVRDFREVVERAGVYAFDNSSSGFEFAALDRPVVVMNAPWYRRNVNHGGRFWDWADIGEQVDGPSDLGSAIVRAFEDRHAKRRHEIIREVLPHADGEATQRAAEALRLRFPPMALTETQERQMDRGSLGVASPG